MSSNGNIRLSYSCVIVAKYESEIAIRIAIQCFRSSLLTKQTAYSLQGSVLVHLCSWKMMLAWKISWLLMSFLIWCWYFDKKLVFFVMILNCSRYEKCNAVNENNTNIYKVYDVPSLDRKYHTGKYPKY